jgi:hypothetical protein
VKHQSAVHRGLREVKCHRFARQQVQGNHVRTECIDNKQLVLAIASFSERQSGVSDDHFDLRRAITQVSKQASVPRDLLHQGIDLIEGELLGGRSVASQCTRAETHNGDFTRLT